MKVQPVRLFRAAMLFGFAGVITKIFLTGQMVKYMSPSLDPLTAAAGIVLAAMGVMELLQGCQPSGSDAAGHEHDDHDHGHESGGIEQASTYLLVMAPIILGLIVIPQALGSSVMRGESMFSLLLAYPSNANQANMGAPPAPSKPISDVPDLLAYLRKAGESGVGQRVRAAGVVVRNDALGGNEFALLRYSIVHCVADAIPVGLLVVTPGDPGVASDGWVEVEGVLAVRQREGDRLVSIAADRVVLAEEPVNPYLPPIF
jgi:putative membrane protein